LKKEKKMSEIVIMIVTGLGSLFVLLAAVGIVRMPDLFLRISVTTKAATLGIGLILSGAAIFFADTSVTTRVLAIIFFLLLTAPVSAHMIGRASYFIGTSLWKKSLIDELKNKYDKQTHALKSEDEKDGEKI
jgi:multicomponent Na+:H+ antiporter subunit G